MNAKPYFLSALLTGAIFAPNANSQEVLTKKDHPVDQVQEYVDYNTHAGRVSRFRTLHSGFSRVEARVKVNHEAKEVDFPVFTLPSELQKKYSNLIDFDSKPAILINSPEKIYYVDTNADVLTNAFKTLKAFVLNKSGQTKTLDMNDVKLNELANMLLDQSEAKVFIASKSSWGIIKVNDDHYVISEDDIPEFKSNLKFEDHQKLKSQMLKSYDRNGMGMELQAFGPREMSFFADWSFVTGSRFKSALFFKDEKTAKVKFIPLDKVLQLCSSYCLEDTKTKAGTLLVSIKNKVLQSK